MAKIDLKFMKMDRSTAKMLGSKYTPKKGKTASKPKKKTQ